MGSNKKSKQELEAGLQQQQMMSQQAAAAVAAQRKPFGDVTSNQNAATHPIAAPMQGKKIEHMGFRAAPVGVAYAPVGRAGPQPVIDFTGNAGVRNTTSELSDFVGEIDERVEGLHDVRGRLDPLAAQVCADCLQLSNAAWSCIEPSRPPLTPCLARVQSFVDQQIQAHLKHAYADMDIKLKQAAHYKAKVLAGTSLEKEASTIMGLMGPPMMGTAGPMMGTAGPMMGTAGPMKGTAGPMMGTAGPMGSSRPMPAPPGCDPILNQEYTPFGRAPSAGSSASRAYGRGPSGGPVWGASAAPSAAHPQLLARPPSTGVYAM